MTFEKTIETVASNLNPIDFGASFFAGAVQKPWNALAQLSRDHLPAMHLVSQDCTTLAGQAGNIAGFAADMLLLSRLTGKMASPLVKGQLSPLGAALKVGVDGAIYGGIFTASDPDSSLLKGRFENAAINGVTFAAMGGAGHMLGDAALFGPTSLKSNVLEGALSGGIGGIAHSFARAGIQDQTLPTLGEVTGDTASYASFGAFFGAGHHWLNEWATAGRARAEPEWEPGSDAPKMPADVQELTTEMAGKASQRIGSWYGLLEPRLAIYLTDPNVVLTLADARGQTEFYVDNPRPLDAAAFEHLNSVTEPQGVRFRSRGFCSDVTGTPGLTVDVESLAGLQKSTAASNLKGVRKFNANEGFAGMDRWKGETANALFELKNSGYYPESAELTHLRIGVAKGYPDEAILALNTPPVAPDPPFLLSTEIPYSDHYLCAEPNYEYSAKDYHRIQLHSNVWGEVLRKYYESGWHRSLAADPLFNELRQDALTADIDAAKRAGFSVDHRRYINAQRSLMPRTEVDG